jgi:hypothetical protein
VSEQSRLPEEYAAEVADFLDFLEGTKPAIFVSGSLTKVLRTDPPVNFGPTAVGDIVADWAIERAARTGERESDLLLYATRTIVDAYNIDAVTSFRPRDFYRPFRAQIVARCSEPERDVLEAALDALQSKTPGRGQLLPASELARVAGSDPRRDLDEAAEQEFDAAVERVRERPHMPEEEFAEAVAVVERFLLGRDSVPTQPALLRAIDAATVAFNGAAVARAGRLFAIVDEALTSPAVAEVRRKDARGALRRRNLDDSILVQWVSDARRRADVAPVVRFFEDLQPEQLLGALLAEKSAQRAQLLLNMLDAHGLSAVPHVLDVFSSPEAAPWTTPHLAGLVGLVARRGAESDVERRRAIDFAGPLLTAVDVTVRASAVAALERLGGREVVPPALRALEAESYKVEPHGDDAKRHLGGVMRLLVRSGLDSAVAVVAETATGGRDGGFQRLGKALRDAAVEALARRDGPLPRRAALAISEALRGMTRLRFGVLPGLALGVDPETCVRLMWLIEDSTEPEAKETLAMPTFRKLAAQSKQH